MFTQAERLNAVLLFLLWTMEAKGVTSPPSQNDAPIVTYTKTNNTILLTCQVNCEHHAIHWNIGNMSLNILGRSGVVTDLYNSNSPISATGRNESQCESAAGTAFYVLKIDITYQELLHKLPNVSCVWLSEDNGPIYSHLIDIEEVIRHGVTSPPSQNDAPILTYNTNNNTILLTCQVNCEHEPIHWNIGNMSLNILEKVVTDLYNNTSPISSTDRNESQCESAAGTAFYVLKIDITYQELVHKLPNVTCVWLSADNGPIFSHLIDIEEVIHPDPDPFMTTTLSSTTSSTNTCWSAFSPNLLISLNIFLQLFCRLLS